MDGLLAFIEKLLIALFGRRSVAGPVPLPLREEAIGTSELTGEGFSLSATDLAWHLYALGSTGCGKTTFVLKLIEADLRAGRSVAVLDLRGDLVDGVIGSCARLGVDPRRVRLLDLREKERPTGYNPLSGSGEPYIRALHVLDVVKGAAASFGVRLEEVLRNALLLLASAGESLVSLDRLLFDDAFRADCLDDCGDEALIGFWERYEGLSPTERNAWALPVMNKVTALTAVPVLRAVLGHPDPIDLGKVLDEPGSVLLVSLAVDELHGSSKMLGSLLVSGIARETMARVKIPERRRNPVRLYVDEFENMATEAFEGIVAEGRRFGLGCVLLHQTRSQIGAKLLSIIRNNVGVQILFQCGFEDAAALARELPKGIEAEDLRNLSTGEAFVMTRDGEAERVRFYPPEPTATEAEIAAYRREVLPEEVPEPQEPRRPEASGGAARRPSTEEWL